MIINKIYKVMPHLYYLNFESLFPLVDYMNEIHRMYGYTEEMIRDNQNKGGFSVRTRVDWYGYRPNEPHRIRVPTK